MKKRFLCLALGLLAALLVAGLILVPVLTREVEDYGIALGKTRITSRNCADVLGDGSVVYDPESNTLTLTDAWFEGGMVTTCWDLTVLLEGTSAVSRGILAKEGLTIQMDSGSRVFGGIQSVGDLTLHLDGFSVVNDGIIVEGDLTVYLNAESAVNEGITVRGDMTVEGDAGRNGYTTKLKVSGGVTVSADPVSGEGGNLLVHKARLKAEGAQKAVGVNYGISADSSVTIDEEAIVYACGADWSETTIGLRTGNLTVSNDSSFHCDGGDCSVDACGIQAENMTVVNGSIVYAQGITKGETGSGERSCGIYLTGDLVVGNRSYVDVTCSPASRASCGLYTGGGVTLADGTLYCWVSRQPSETGLDVCGMYISPEGGRGGPLTLSGDASLMVSCCGQEEYAAIYAGGGIVLKDGLEIAGTSDPVSPEGVNVLRPVGSSTVGTPDI